MTDEPTMNELIAAVIRSEEIDESGDASVFNFLVENRDKFVLDESITLRQHLTEYLIWANGLEWQEFLATAEVGDVPPGQ